MASSETYLDLAANVAARLRAAVVPDASGAAVALDDALAAVASDVVSARVADWCLLELASDGVRDARLVTVAHRDQAAIARARTLHGSGSQLADQLGWSSSIDVPLAARESELGVLTLASANGSLGAAERQLAQVLAGLLAGALETAYLVAERDEILVVVSHDMRNPLGVILLVIDLLRGLELPEEIRSQMARLERASQTMSRIITDVVDIGRLGTVSVPLELKSVSAAAAVDSAWQLSAAIAEARNVRLDRSVDSSLQITADGDRLARALDLLVGGAVQRTPANRSVAVSVERQADRVVWSVADGAPPLPVEPGSTASAIIRRRAGAFTWMVLRGVVRAHGGVVWVEDTRERVTIRFALPVAASSRTTRRATR